MTVWWGRISDKGEVTIPAKLRRALRIRKGTRYIMFEEDRRIVVELVRPGASRKEAAKKLPSREKS